MEAVLRALPDLFMRLDADGVVLEHRSGSAALPEGVAGGLVGRRLQEVLPEEVGGRLGVALAEARRTARPTFFAWTVEGEPGGREVEARVVPTGARQAILLVREATERTAAVRALRAGEEHLRRLTENATDMVQIVGADGRIVYTGPSVLHLLGYAPEALAGTLATDYIHPDDVAHVVAGMGTMLASPGVFYRDEYRVRHADGTWRLFEGNCRTLSPTSPEEGIVVNARDITDRKRAEDALRQSEERWRTVIANTHDIISVLDAEGRVTFQSPAFERVLGYSEADMLGRSAFDLVHPEDVAATMTALRQIVAQPGSTGHAEYRYRHRDGHWRRLETFGRTLLPDSPEAGMVFNSRDVTERWEAAERLRRSEEHFRALAENASDLISVLDAEGRYTYQSPALGQLLGWRADEVLGRAPWEFMHPDDLGAAQTALLHMVAAPGTSHTVQYRCRHRDGSWRVLESTGRTLLPHSAADGIVAISRDVTARRQVEEALRQATADAEQAREEAERPTWRRASS
jgi:PAS domain S-box-containing protein